MKRVSASNSFNEDEVQVLDFIFTTLSRGGDPRMATRHKAFPSLVRKAVKMKSVIERAKADSEPPPSENTETET